MYQNLPTKVGFGPKSYSLIGTNFSSGLVISGKSIDIDSIKTKIEKITSSEILHISIGKERQDLNSISKLASRYDTESIDYVIAIGGGSIIDFAKLFRQQLFKLRGYSCPLYVIPSVIGSGAESSMTAIINAPDEKIIKVQEDFIPDGIIYDYGILKSLSSEQIILGHLDAITHCVESLTSFNSNLFSQFLALFSLKEFVQHHDSSQMNFDELGKKDLAQLSLLSFNGGVCQNNAGAGLTHALAHSLESLSNKGHSLCIAFFLPVVLKYVYENDLTFSLKSEKNFNTYIDKRLAELCRSGVFDDINSFLKIESNFEECLTLASSDPCWRLFYKKVDNGRLKELILECLWN